MKSKKIVALLLCAVTLIPTFASCSKPQETALTTKKVVVVDDSDDGVDDNRSVKAEKTTIDIKDKDGNIVTTVPVYNVDGATAIAVYIESARDKSGKPLNQKQYPYIKQVVAVGLDKLGQVTSFMYNDGKLISLNALSDKKGYIIAIQDIIDIDKDKDNKEYFKAVTKVDSLGNLFIKLEKGKDGKPVNVTVDSEKGGKKRVTTSDGKSVVATQTDKSKNLKDVAEEETTKKNKETTSNNKDNTTTGSGNNGNTTTNNTTKPAREYVPIVLLKGGKVACDAKNVKIEKGTFDTGPEVIINGKGECGKYYITSETDVFLGHLDFRLSVDESVEIKINNVNIDTKRKTALKFTNVDKDNNKVSDTEDPGKEEAGSSQSAEATAPKVNLVLTGDNKFKAHGVGTNGTIYSECRLDIQGHGTAEIDGGQNLSGICSTESIDIRNATLNITSNAKQGISCDRKVTIEFGTDIDIKSKGDGIHCNKFEMCSPSEFPEKGNVSPAKVKIQSLYTENCADGVDANDYIIINGGTLDVTALSTGKYGLKVRNREDEAPKGQFEINGGKVTVSALINTALTSCKQKTVMLSGVKQQFSIDGYTSAENSASFICSPCSADTVTMLNLRKKKTEYKINWQDNIGTAKSTR